MTSLCSLYDWSSLEVVKLLCNWTESFGIFFARKGYMKQGGIDDMKILTAAL